MAALIMIGLVLLICGSDLVLEDGIALATELGVDQFTIGLAGTFTPLSIPDDYYSIPCRSP